MARYGFIVENIDVQFRNPGDTYIIVRDVESNEQVTMTGRVFLKILTELIISKFLYCGDTEKEN